MESESPADFHKVASEAEAEAAAEARLEAPPDFEELRRQLRTKKELRKMSAAKLYDTIQALREAEELRDASDYGAALTAMGHRMSGGFSEEAVELLEEMRQQSIEPRAEHFCRAMASARWDQEWELALALHDQMKRSGIDADQTTYAFLLGALARGGAWEHALQVLDDDLPRDGVEPSLRLYSAALSSCEFGGQWMGAMRVFEGIYKAELEPDVVAWTALINACARGGQLPLMSECLEQMIEEGIMPNVITYNSVIRGCVDMGEMEKAVRVREALIADGVKPTSASFDATLKGCARYGLWEQALEEFREMTGEPHSLNPTVGTWTSLINVLDKAGPVRHALRLLPKAMKWRGFRDTFTHMEDSDAVPPKAAYVAAIKACEEQGKWQEALRVLGHMKARGVAPGALVATLVEETGRKLEDPVIENQLRVALEECGESEPLLQESPTSTNEASLGEAPPLWARD